MIMNYNPFGDSYSGDQECVGTRDELDNGQTSPTTIQSYIENEEVEDVPNDIPQNT